LPALLNDEYVPTLLEKLFMKDLDEVYASVGHGSLASAKVIKKLSNLYEQYNKQDDIKVIKTFNGDKREKTTDLLGLNGIMTKLAKCCNPVPGDEIVGYVSRGRGITIHRADCQLLNSLEPDRLMNIDWGKTNTESKYTAVITIIAKNSPTTLALISNKFAENKININYIYSNTNKSNDAIYHIGIEVKSKQELNDFINKLKAMQEVYDVKR
jgi:GTP diphosphokinase / guanosine-3',5'-bis(diphosphate) 3'-diphosphatase